MKRSSASAVRAVAFGLGLACAGCYDGAFEGARSESNRVQTRIENDPLTQRLRGSGPASRDSNPSDGGLAPAGSAVPAAPNADAGKTGSDIEI